MPNEHPATRKFPRSGMLLAIFLAAMPAVLLAYKLSRHGLAFPYWDEILIAPFIEKAKTGQVSFIDLWSQHNEHRPFFPRLVMLLLALPTNWNVAWILAANFFCGVLSFALLARLAWRLTPNRATPKPWAILPALAFFIFSWAQMENWAWGLELTVFMCTLFAVATVVLLSRGDIWGYAGAIATAVAATYSFANGMFIWLAAVPVLLAVQNRREQKILRILLWAAAAALTIESYFVAYQKPEVSPSLTAVFHAPFAYLGYILLYLGSPIVAIFSTPPWHGGPPHPYGPFHFLPGIAGVLLFFGLGVELLWRRRISWRLIAPWISVAAFAGISALATGVGRVGFGIAEGLNSRYMTTNALFWCALCGLAALAWRPRRRAPVIFAVAAALLIAAQVSLVYRQRPWEDNARWKNMGWNAVASGYPARLYLLDLWGPDQEILGPTAMQDRYFPLLERYHLCGYGRRPDPAQATRYLEEAKRFIAEQNAFPALTYLNTALYFDPALQEAAALRSQIPAEIQARFQAFERGETPQAKP